MTTYITPTYIGRSGSECYFTLDKNFVDQNKTKAIELISLYTLFMFGYSSTNSDHQVLILGGSGWHKYSLKKCMAMLVKNTLVHRVFHLSTSYEKKLLNNFEGDCILTNDISSNVPVLENFDNETYHNLHCCISNGYSTCTVDTYNAQHLIIDDSTIADKYHEDNKYHEDIKYTFIKKSERFDYMTDYFAEDYCKLCYTMETNEDTKYEKELPVVNTNYNELPEYEKEPVIINNLIFDFRNYKFNIKTKENITTVTFDPKAIGGFRHASFFTGYINDVIHVMSDLEYVKTTYVNTIKITMKEIKNTSYHYYHIIAEYKAIDTL